MTRSLLKPVRYAGALVAPVVLAGSVVVTLSRLLGSEALLLVLAGALTPWAVVGYAVALVLFLLLSINVVGSARALLAAGIALCVLGVGLHLVWLAPSYVGARPGGQAQLTVLSQNMRLGQGDPQSLAALIRRERPDVVVLTETTPQALAAVEATGVLGRGSRLKHRGGRALPLGSGTVVASRWRLDRRTTLPVVAGAFRMRVEAPRPFWLTAVHAGQPLVDVAQWRADHRALLASQRGLRGPRLMAGDFNATLDHAPIRRLLDTGLHDAAREANSGVQPTWPAPRWMRVFWVRPPFSLITIDHVLVSRQLATVSTSAHTVSNTDHRGLVAHLRWR